MQTIHTGYRGLRLLVDLNWDRGLYLGVLAAGLLIGLWMCNLEAGSLSLNKPNNSAVRATFSALAF
jgi:hypothetical protein